MTVLDTRARPLRDLRISVTDRCNFRCVYCMPKEVFGRDYEFLARDELLTFEEIERLARAAVALGATKLRITGGEPLVRRDVERLIALLAPLPADLTLTTNGALLAAKARALAGRRPAADHGQPRLARRRDLPRDERRRLPGVGGARRDRGRTRRRAAREGELRRQARRQRRRDRPARPPLPRDRRHAAVHRVHGRRRDERLAARRRRPRRRDRRRARPRVRGRAARPAATAARSRAATGTATARARSA